MGSPIGNVSVMMVESSLDGKNMKPTIIEQSLLAEQMMFF